LVNVVLIRDAVVAQDVAQVPEFRDNVGGVHGFSGVSVWRECCLAACPETVSAVVFVDELS